MNKIMLFSDYINNASNFAKPLTVSQEKECFEKFWQGEKQGKAPHARPWSLPRGTGADVYV